MLHINFGAIVCTFPTLTSVDLKWHLTSTESTRIPGELCIHIWSMKFKFNVWCHYHLKISDFGLCWPQRSSNQVSTSSVMYFHGQRVCHRMCDIHTYIHTDTRHHRRIPSSAINHWWSIEPWVCDYGTLLWFSPIYYDSTTDDDIELVAIKDTRSQERYRFNNLVCTSEVTQKV